MVSISSQLVGTKLFAFVRIVDARSINSGQSKSKINQIFVRFDVKNATLVYMIQSELSQTSPDLTERKAGFAV